MCVYESDFRTAPDPPLSNSKTLLENNYFQGVFRVVRVCGWGGEGGAYWPGRENDGSVNNADGGGGDGNGPGGAPVVISGAVRRRPWSWSRPPPTPIVPHKGMHIKSVSVGVVYDKSLRLSQVARQSQNTGSIVNYMQVS